MTHIFFAPLQGYTDDAYRRLHHQHIGGVDTYLSPFLRMEGKEVRRKDLRDILPEHNQGVPLLPQVIAGSAEEFCRLVDAVQEQGYDCANLNMGCPFTLQVRHRHGAGLLPHPALVEEICRSMERYPGMRFSVKMRLGAEGSEEWREVLPILNSVPLEHITMHPRRAADQYRGTPDMEAFGRFVAECKHPLVYNGDLRTPDEARQLLSSFPSLHGIMLGRGLLARPTLAQELRQPEVTYTQQQHVEALLTLHNHLHAHYAKVLHGDAALLQKLRTYWDYTEPTIGRKAWKQLHKAGSLRNYLAALPTP